MTTKISSKLAVAFGWMLAASGASAHAQLQQGVPAVGGRVQASPPELVLHFSEGIEPRFSSVALSGENGGAVPVGRPAVALSDASIVTVRIGRRLTPGTYVVTWRVTSVDSHKTQGSYRFTVGP